MWNMKKVPAKTVLWENVVALMKHHWGEENLNRLSREAKIGVGSAARLKAMETSTGLDIVEAIAERFGVESWQLLLPDFDPVRPVQMPKDKDRRDWLGAYDRLNPRRRRKLLDMAEEFSEGETGNKEAGGSM
jgi:hypothetical protein